jgi:biotin carboxyl carrier protein
VRFEATVGEQTLPVEVHADAEGYRVRLADRVLAVRVDGDRGGFLTLTVDGKVHELGVESEGGATLVHFPERILRVELVDATYAGVGTTRKGPSGPARVTAPMPGRIVRVLVEPGQEVAAGQGLLVMEAMKMENELRAPRAGRVAEVAARERAAVETGALLVVLE